MPKAKPPKNLVVDGTAKLAAKSKPSDKHEAPDLNIEEATVASPRPSRKRAGDFFDFDDGADAEPSSKPAEPKATKPNKKTKMKTAPTGKDENSNEVESKPAATEKRGRKRKGGKDEVAESPSATTSKAVEKKEKKPRKPKVVKDDVAEGQPESSKTSKNASKEPAVDKTSKIDAAPKTTKDKTKTKAKKSKAEKGSAGHESSAVAPEIAMDEGPFETILESEKGQAPGTTEEQPITGPLSAKGAKTAKKPAKGSEVGKVEAAKASAAEAVADGADSVKKGTKAGTEKATKAAKAKTPNPETAADVADAVRKGAKAGTKRAKQTAKSLVSAAEDPAGVADVVNKNAKAGAEKIKKGVKSKESKPAEDNESVKLPGSSGEQTKPEASKSKKRKAPAGADTDMVKADILDPLSEHASAKKRQKKTNAKAKSLGDTVGDAVGELLATATEGANAARASLGGLANSILGGASEATVEATDAKESAKASAKKAQGKAKAIAEDVAESSGKIAADVPGGGDLEDDSDDEPDDHTNALLAGLDSDGDEGVVSGPGFQKGQAIPQLPEADETAKKLEGVKDGASEGPGVVYVGRIPHGFYEHEMREYFSQFGDISRLRLSRNLKSGASKHYAFVEFTSAGVAQIVADTMNNYLMFGHILKCKVVAKEQLHASVWKGANKRFKTVPWNKIEGRKFEVGLGREQWAERIEEENKRRASKNEKTKEIGYEFEATALKGVDEVPVRDAAKKIENGEKIEEEKSLVTAGGEGGNGPVVVSKEVKTKRVKKSRGQVEETTTAVAKKTKRALDAGEEALGSAIKKAKKGKGAAA